MTKFLEKILKFLLFLGGKNNMVTSQFVFFDETSTEGTSNIYINNSVSDAMMVQSESLGETDLLYNVIVEGAIDYNRPDSFFPLKIINLGTLKTTDTISNNNLYMINVSGINKIRMTLDTNTSDAGPGQFRIFATTIE